MPISKAEAVEIAQKYLWSVHHLQLPVAFTVFVPKNESLLDHSSDVWSVYFDPAPLEGHTVIDVDAQTGRVYQKDCSSNETIKIKQDLLYVAYLTTPLFCPNCKNRLYEEIPFQWGLCFIHWINGSDHQPKQKYHLGDAIRWSNSTTKIQATLDGFSADAEANIGNPEIEDLLVINFEVYSFGPCPHCRYAEGAAAIHIRNGIIIEANLYDSEQFGEANSIYIIDANGALVPVPKLS